MDKSEIHTPVDVAVLHKAIMITGKTESTITKVKVPKLKIMGWNKAGSLFIIIAEKLHILPAAAVSDTTVLI